MGRGGRIRQLCCELLDLVDYAVAGRTVRGHGASWQRRWL